MRPRVLILAATIGLATTIGVSWLLVVAQAIRNAPYATVRLNVPIGEWPGEVPPEWPPPQFANQMTVGGVTVVTAHGPVRGELEPQAPRQPPVYPLHHQVIYSGFPFAALRRERDPGAPGPESASLRHGIPAPFLDTRSAQPECRLLPVLPWTPGFALDWIAYSACALAWPAYAALRRRSRVRRGLCAGCGYPRAQSGACPECGRAEGSA